MQESENYEEMVRKMDGKFAFILYDESRNFLFIGRDHVGLCPMYWGQNKDGSIYIASELKALEGLCEDFSVFPPGYIYTSTHGLKKWYDPEWEYTIPSPQHLNG
jgi:asparagine synthase (glutamine-hydrolysing)